MILYILLNVVALALIYWAKGKLDAFVSAHPSISSQRDLAAFEEVARMNMYLALVQIGLLGGSLLLGLYLIWQEGLLMLLVVLAANGAVFFFARVVKVVEERARGLQCATPDLASAYGKVIETWKKKALPDF